MMTAGSSQSGSSSGTMVSWGSRSQITQGTVTAVDDPERRRGGRRRARPGVGPHPLPWPDDRAATTPSCSPRVTGATSSTATATGRVEAIVADLDTRRHPLHVAIQNWEHDFNIGSIVRTANAFNVAGVHIVGRRRWNRRGAMVTDRYLHVHHHADVAELRRPGWPRDDVTADRRRQPARLGAAGDGVAARSAAAWSSARRGRG